MTIQPKKLPDFFSKLPKKKGDAALAYAEKLGWRIMPLHAMRSTDGAMACSCGHADCEAPGKHPLVKNGEASADPEVVKAWWKKWPWANIGFWLEGSKLAILDVDVGGKKDKDGAARLRELLGDQPLQDTLVCATPSGGKHIYYLDREGLPNKSNALGDGLDIWRGKHYVILPPSNHVSGKADYHWERVHDIEEWPDILMPRGRGRPPGTPNPNAGRPSTRERVDINDKDDLARLYHALSFCDATDRDTWVHCGYILARLHFYSEDGWRAFNDWAATAHNYSEKESRQIYFLDSHNPPAEMALTSAYIFKKATENPKFTRWEKQDARLKFFESEGHEAEDIRTLTDLVARCDLEMYEREGRLIEVIRIDRMSEGEKKALAAQGIERDDAYCITRELSPGQFTMRASHSIAWWRKIRGKMRITDFNRKVVIDFLNLGGWQGMKRFKAFTLHPTIRSLSSPTLLLNPGFDRDSGLYLEQPIKVSVPQKPSAKDAKAAAKVLLSPYEHYYFIDGDQSRAGLLALLLTIGIRHCFKTAPMFLATSPVVGSGKTKLMTSAAALWYGAAPPAMIFVENEEEMEKRIGASVMAGDRVLLFDNVMANLAVNDRTLNTILTSGAAEFRILGESTKVRMSAPMTIMMTGNQMVLGADLARRTIELKIDPQGPMPTQRKFPFEPLEFVLAHRKTLIEAALTILAAYFSGSRHINSTNAPIPSFEEWSVIRDLVLWLGMPDISQFSAPQASEDDLYYPMVVKRMLKMLSSVTEIDLMTRKAHPGDFIPALIARGKEWETLFFDACECLGYMSSDRTPKPDDPRSVGAILQRMADQSVDVDGRRLRLKAIKRRTFWLAQE